jgi:hypothetical protein
VVVEVGVPGQEPALVPAGIAARAEEVSPHIVVQAVDLPAKLAKVIHDL